MIRQDPKTIALRYIEACGRGDFDAVQPLLAHDVVFHSPWGRSTGSGPLLATLRRLGTVWRSSGVRKVFTDGSEVCVIYDLVTDTVAGAVPAMEWVKVELARISKVTVLIDRAQFAPAAYEVNRRALGLP